MMVIVTLQENMVVGGAGLANVKHGRCLETKAG
jgi:hypothetical protein